MLALINDLIVAASFGENLATLMQTIIGPIFLVVCGIMAFKFLKDQQMMQFIIFLVVAIVVAAIIYAPNFIKQIGSGLGNDSNLTW